MLYATYWEERRHTPYTEAFCKPEEWLQRAHHIRFDVLPHSQAAAASKAPCMAAVFSKSK